MRTLTPTSALLTLRSRPQKVNGNVGNRMKMKRNHGVRGRVNLSPRRKPMERLAKKATGRPVKERRRKSQNYSWPLNGTKRDLTPLDGGYLRSWMVFGAYFPFFFSRRSPCVLTRGIERTLTERLSTADSATPLRPLTGSSKVRVLHRTSFN